MAKYPACELKSRRNNFDVEVGGMNNPTAELEKGEIKKMLVKISSMSESQVAALLKEADADSHIDCGSHTDILRQVIVNGMEYTPFEYHELSFTGTGPITGSDENQEPVDRLPAIADIKSAAIVETYHRYGGNSRDRASVQLFLRASNNLFLVIDMGEVEGWRPYSKLRPMDISLEWALWSAQKKVRVEVDEKIDPSVFQIWIHRSIVPTDLQGWAEKQFSLAAQARRELEKFVPASDEAWESDREVMFPAFKEVFGALPIGQVLSKLGKEPVYSEK